MILSFIVVVAENIWRLTRKPSARALTPVGPRLRYLSCRMRPDSAVKMYLESAICSRSQAAVYAVRPTSLSDAGTGSTDNTEHCLQPL